ncbi:hypothetical protein J4P41_11335 [Gluconobacter sp. NFX36]|uniref:hypothetical protein n=1 Tax=Gluconobacter TaxID=441 RepID=UPI003CF671F4
MRVFQILLALSLVTFGLGACGSGIYTPETTNVALKADPSGVVGKFRITVRGVVWHNDSLFLISDQNYRNPNAVVVMLDDDTVRDILRGRTQTAEQYFMGHEILATGLARKIRIVVRDREGNLTGASYEQVRIVIGDAADLDVLSR